MMNARLANVVKTYEEEDKQKAEGNSNYPLYVIRWPRQERR